VTGALYIDGTEIAAGRLSPDEREEFAGQFIFRKWAKHSGRIIEAVAYITDDDGEEVARVPLDVDPEKRGVWKGRERSPGVTAWAVITRTTGGAVGITIGARIYQPAGIC